MEPPAADGTKLGSYRIAKMIAQAEGLRGFYVGGLVTAIHDGIASGGFFAACEWQTHPPTLRSLRRGLS